MNLTPEQRAKMGAALLCIGDVLDIYRAIQGQERSMFEILWWSAIASEAILLQADIERLLKEQEVGG